MKLSLNIEMHAWSANSLSRHVSGTSGIKPNVKLSPIKQGLETFPCLNPCEKKDGCVIQLEQSQ